MTIPLQQKFQIGGVVFSAFTGAAAVLAGWGLSPNTVTAIIATTGLLGTIWNGIGIVLTGPGAIAQSAAQNIESPGAKVPLVQAVSQLKGVKESIQVDITKASPDLVAAAQSTSQANDKIEVAK